MLALKLLLVPGFLWLISAAGARWGASIAGWLAGLPVVAGPILLFITLEQGEAFGAEAAAAALAAVAASITFSVAYAHAAQRRAWPLALAGGLLAWFLAAFGLAQLPGSLWASLAVALFALLAAPRLFPPVATRPAPRRNSGMEIACRMLAGAALTVSVTLAAATVGHAWSGLLAVFPVLGSVLSVFTHRGEGPLQVAALLRAMATGLLAFAAFSLALALLLPRLGTAGAFLTALACALCVQAGTGRRLRRVQ